MYTRDYFGFEDDKGDGDLDGGGVYFCKKIIKFSAALCKMLRSGLLIKSRQYSLYGNIMMSGKVVR